MVVSSREKLRKIMKCAGCTRWNWEMENFHDLDGGKGPNIPTIEIPR
jgi:hypothetical protein